MRGGPGMGPEAVAACEGKADGDACTFDAKGWTMQGVCSPRRGGKAGPGKGGPGGPDGKAPPGGPDGKAGPGAEGKPGGPETAPLACGPKRPEPPAAPE